jgi:hypothetical protein
MTLVRIVSPRFVAGVVVNAGRVAEAAPILRWTLGLSADALRAAVAARGWRASIVPEHPRA